MATVTQMKCACPSCLCIVSVEDAVMVDNKPYCSDVPMVILRVKVVVMKVVHATSAAGLLG